MRKKIFRFIFNLTNPTEHERAKELFALLTENTSTQHQINSFENFREMFEQYLIIHNRAIKSESKSIDVFLPKSYKIDINDPIFDKPLNN